MTGRVPKGHGLFDTERSGFEVHTGMYPCILITAMKGNPLAVAPCLGNYVIFKLDAAFRIISARAEEVTMRTLHVNKREIWIMIAASESKLSQGIIADCLGVNRNVMVLEIDRLEKRGYLRRIRNSANRREQIIALTPKGKKLVRSLNRMRRETLREVLRPLVNGQIEQMKEWTQAVIDSEFNTPKTPKTK